MCSDRSNSTVVILSYPILLEKPWQWIPYTRKTSNEITMRRKTARMSSGVLLLKVISLFMWASRGLVPKGGSDVTRALD